jgi:hypothetical protein
MRYSLAKLLRLAPFGIHMVRVEITSLPCMQDDICLSNGAS